MLDLSGCSHSNKTYSAQDQEALQRAFNAFGKGDFRQVIQLCKSLVERDNDIHQAHYLVGRVALITQELNIGLASFQKAADCAPNVSDYWAFLSLVLLQSGQMTKAENAVEKAQALEPTEAEVLSPIAHVLSELGHFDQSNKVLHQAIEAAPNDPSLHHDLGANQLEMGDFKEAKQSFETAVGLDDFDVKSWWMLSSLDKATDNKRADHLVQKMAQTRNYPIPHAYLGYAAGKWYEDTESWEKAYNAYLEGASAKRRTLKYDQSADKAVFDTIKRLCTKEWLQSGAHSKQSSDDSTPIFIVGQPRTGTTLVDRIISSHSHVESMGEHIQFPRCLRVVSSTNTREFISKELVENALSIDSARLVNEYLRSVDYIRGESQYFIDKFPLNFMLVGFIIKAFPNAKIIHLTRSPADTCFSVFKHLFGEVYPHSYDQKEMANHFVMYHQLMSHWHSIMPGKILDVAYEDVVADHESQARRLLEYLELDWEDSCANFEKNKAAVVTASAVQVREKVHQRSVSRWKRYEKQLKPTLDILAAAGIDP